MSTIRIWALESDYDAEAVRCLANKLVTHLQLGNLSIRASGKSAFPPRARTGAPRSDRLKMATQDYLIDEDCVIFVIDSDGRMSDYQRRKEPNSLINQIEKVVADTSFAGKVFLAQAVQELEAWLLIDCLGIFCYFASKRAQFRENCRDKVSTNQNFKRLVQRYQKGNTENIVEAEIGGSGAKEYLKEFSEQILLKLNPNIPQKNIHREWYRDAISFNVAVHVVIDRQTLRHNNSLRELGDVLAQFN